MHHHGRSRRIVALAAVVALHAWLVPCFASDGPASLSGTVVQSETWEPRSGTVLRATNPVTGETFRSQPSADDGSFLLAGLPAASYRLAAEADGGVYPIDQALPLAANQNRVVSVVLDPAPPSTGPANIAPGQTAKKPRRFSNPGTAVAIVVGSAFFLGLVIEAADGSDGAEGSPSNP